MFAAGVNVVSHGRIRLGHMQRKEGQYDFAGSGGRWTSWDGGNQGRSCTPTAAPPLWLAKKHPENAPCGRTRPRQHQGTRRACCLNNDIYWDYCRRIVRAMASDLSEHPQLIAWQIDNGIGGHNTESASMRSRAVIGSRGSRQNKRPSTVAMNLGTRFWGR